MAQTYEVYGHMGMYLMILVVIWASLQFSPSEPQLWVNLRWSLWMLIAANLGVRLTFAAAKSFLCHPKYVFQAPNQYCWSTESNRGICFKIYAKKTVFLGQKYQFLGHFWKVWTQYFCMWNIIKTYFAIPNSIFTPADKNFENFTFSFFPYFCSFFSNIFFIFWVWKFFWH